MNPTVRQLVGLQFAVLKPYLCHRFIFPFPHAASHQIWPFHFPNETQDNKPDDQGQRLEVC